jgi:hypothetical protein
MGKKSPSRDGWPGAQLKLRGNATTATAQAALYALPNGLPAFSVRWKSVCALLSCLLQKSLRHGINFTTSSQNHTMHFA